MPESETESARFRAALRRLGSDVLQAYWNLLKLMVPTLLIVKLLDMAGATQWIGLLLAPMMALVGLPEPTGIVLASIVLTNLYTGLALFFVMLPQMDLTVAQVTVLGTLMLMAHSLPVEGAIAKAAGIPWRATLALRVGGSFLLGAMLDRVYRAGGWLQQRFEPAWQPDAPAGDLAGWAIDQATMLVTIFVVLAGLMVMLKLMRLIGIERLVHQAMFPLLRLTGISRQAANVTVIGVTLGITFGAGLLLRDVRSGTLSRRDIWLSIGFLGLAHSLIEDTLLILLIGADLSGILWARLLFAIALIGLLARLPAMRRVLDGDAAVQR
ncbi:hypothetical protein [Piscinibacter sakaiensis]|uniref:hypothetical protein n=1 Tax=Piscinibacter sakaiensis TaxID=1547922 RepID=UPI003AAF3164